MSLGSILSGYWSAFQAQLFPALEQDLGPLGERYQAFVRVVEFVRVERLLASLQLRGRPQNDRAAVARAFIAKAVFDITTTRALIARLANDWTLRRLCGWSSVRAIPSEATFSRAFSEFADSALPSRLHAAARGHHAGSSGRARLARFDGDRRPRETGAEAKAAGHVEAQARPAAQGRATAQEAAASSGASAGDDPGADACRPAKRR